MASDLCSHPELVEDVEDIISRDIISKDKLEKLRNDVCGGLDPNAVMDFRHKEDKKKSKVQDSYEGTNQGLTLTIKEQSEKRNSGERFHTELLTGKDLKIIDKEIAQTRRHLEMFNLKLEKKKESLDDDILKLETIRDQFVSNCLPVVNLNEEETKHYFNLHLDQLEDNISNSLKKVSRKTWKPFEVKPSPVIGVITTLKTIDANKQLPMKFDVGEQDILRLCDIKPVEITGQTIQDCSSELLKPKEVMNVVPNNSPDVLVPVVDETSKLKEKELAHRVVKMWKSFVKTKIVYKIVEEKRKILAKNILKVYFNLWVKYANDCQKIRKYKLSDAIKNEIYAKDNMTNQLERPKIRKSVELQQNRKMSCAQLYVNKDKCKPSLTSCKVVKIISIGGNDSLVNNSSINKVTTNQRIKCKKESKVNVEVVTPEEVGSNNKEIGCTREMVKNNRGVKKIFYFNGNTMKGNQELPSKPCTVYEQIIMNQKDVIKKQKWEIMDLKLKIHQTNSKLNLNTVERHIAEIPMTFDKKFNPGIKTILVQRKQCLEDPNKKNITKEVKSDMLTKSLIARQEYCKQLNEMTKARKIRMEEEKEKQRLEHEEKVRLIKEEEKKLKFLKNKMEKQETEEKTKNVLAAKLHMEILTKKAINHHNYVLLRKAFNRLKLLTLDISLRSYQCADIYERKLMRKVFTDWKKETRNIISLKYNMADKFYNRKLMQVCWSSWSKLQQDYKIKVQVSEDMFSLKLQERTFRRWKECTVHQYLQTCCKMELAGRLYRRQLLRHYFGYWKLLPRLMFVEREKELRRRAWRKTVQQIIPDFSPTFSDHKLS